MNLIKINFISSIFIGVIAAFGAMIVQILFSSFFYNQDAQVTLRSGGIVIIAFFSAIEEVFKYVLIFQNHLRIKKSINSIGPEKIEGKLSLEQTESEWKSIRTHRGSFRSAIFIGLGFAMTEGGLAIFNQDAGLQVLQFGIWGIFIIHIITSGIIGYYITNRNILFQSLILVCVFSLHLLYNSMVLMEFDYIVIYTYFIILASTFALSCRIAKSC